jgi:hypothetical protein
VGRIINPDSAVLQQTDGHWQKLAAIILWKLNGGAEVSITSADIERFNAQYAPGIPVLFTHGTYDGLRFSIVTEDAAERIAQHDKKLRGVA